MKTRKILYIHQSAGGGGASNSLALLVSSLDRSKYEPVALLGRYGPVVELFERKDIKTYIRRLSTFSYNTHSPEISAIKILSFLIRFLPNIIAVYRIIRNEEIELVHLNSSVLVTSAIASRLAAVKAVWYIREIIPNTRVGRLQKRLIEFISSDIVAISKEVEKQFDKRKTTLIYNGIDPEEFKPNSEKEVIRKKYRLNEEEAVFTHIGQLNPVKGTFIFLKAAKLLVESGYNVRFFVIGGRPTGSSSTSLAAKAKAVVKYLLRHQTKNRKEELESFAYDQGIAERVIFAGYRDDVPNFISLSDAVVAPHYVPEPFGRVLIEAGALRKPIISTNIPPTPEIVIDGQTGILVEPNSPEALAEAMEYVINNPTEARKMGENGYQNVVNNFHIDVTHSKITELYERALSRRRGG